MTSRRLACVLLIAIVLLSPISGVEACGPFFEPDVFVRVSYPDDLAAFDKGHLGILQSGYDSNEYAVAYRYLNGGKLSEAETTASGQLSGPGIIEDQSRFPPAQIATTEAASRQEKTDSRPPDAWLLDRAKYVPAIEQAAQEQSFPKDFEGNIVFDPNYLNCPNPAFQNAVLTLNKRADSWGKQSPWLVDWIRGQDAVFSNCTSKGLIAPDPAPANGPALLRADRAYQIASAAFYAKQYDQAAQGFEAIAHDKTSPWNAWGEYLAARAIVRKAFVMGKATDPYSGDVASFDLGTMQEAQHILETLLAKPDPLPSRNIVVNELNFIRLRTDPETRLTEICAALAGPASDDNFGQDLQDLSYVLMKHIAIKNPPPLYAWIAAFRGGGADTAFAIWQQNHALPWLVMAIIKAAPTDNFASQLLAEAEKIKPNSPAYDTVFYHRVRLLIGLNRADEARSLLDKALPAMRSQPRSSNENALLAERLTVARNFDEFLEFAPRKVLETTAISDDAIAASCNHTPTAIQRPDYCPKEGDPPRMDRSREFDEDSAYVLNRQIPLDMLADAATSPRLPSNLRQEVALAAWTRSVVLEDTGAAAKLTPLLPNSLRQMAGTGVGFSANLAILRNPGLRPYLEPGLSRLVDFSVLDNYRDNWWSDEWDNPRTTNRPASHQLQSSTSITKQQQQVGNSEYERLIQLPHAAALLGQRVIDYAKAHPADPEIPEALALTVRATHLSQGWSDYASGNAKNSAVSKAAFELLHTRYPKSPWAVKTRYYY